MSSRRPRRALAAATLGAALLAAGPPAGAHAPARQATARARLSLKALDPPTVEGRGFAPRERVRLALQGLRGGTRVRHRRASADGTFRVAFARARAGRCDAFSVRARGQAGSRAMVRRFQLPGCSTG
jgi:hypothetical protein